MPRIVLIDDDQLTLDLVADALSDAGLEVSPTRDPAEVGPLALRTQADMVLVDVNMGDAPGDLIVRQLIDHHGVRAPIFLFSGIEERALERLATLSGAHGFICKTWGMRCVIDHVLEAVGLPARNSEY